MVTYNGVDYFYVYNLQGDVVALIDANGTQVVEYVYDAWGNPISKTGTLAATLGTLNPFRYRGYVYDEETGLYYLRSRYYNPVWKRFLNSDAVLGVVTKLISHNIFCYCSNGAEVKADADGTKEENVSIDNYLRYIVLKTPQPIEQVIPEAQFVPQPEMPEDVRAAVEGAGVAPGEGFEYSSSCVNGDIISVTYVRNVRKNIIRRAYTEEQTFYIKASIDEHLKIGDYYDRGEKIMNNGFGGDFLNALDSAVKNDNLSFVINVVNFICSLIVGGQMIAEHLPRTTQKPTLKYKVISKVKKIL